VVAAPVEERVVQRTQRHSGRSNRVVVIGRSVVVTAEEATQRDVVRGLRPTARPSNAQRRETCGERLSQ
jgi:hypothetical protein